MDFDTEVQRGGTETGGDFVDSLISAGDSGFDEGSPLETTPAAEVTPEVSPEVSSDEVDAPAESTPEEAAEESSDDTVAAIAKEYGLDPGNPGHAAVIAQLAKLRQTDAKPADTSDAEQPDLLAEFERQLTGAAEPEKPAAQTEQPAADATGPLKFGDVGDTWAGPPDAYKALSEAYAGDEENPTDFGKVADVSNAIFARQFASIGQHFVKQMLQSAMREQFGPLLQEAQAKRDTERFIRHRSEAAEFLSKKPGFEDVGKMLEPESDQQITFNGDKFANTPINQVFAKYPELRHLSIQHKDPEVAQRLTHAARLEAAHRRWKEMKASKASIPVDRAKDLVKSGQKIEQKKATDRDRAVFNAGSGASGTGTAATGKDDFFERITRPAGGMTLDELLSKR